jgi:hypothetical protein
MATFNEIYQSYLQNPYAGVNAIAPVQGIGSLQIQPVLGIYKSNQVLQVLEIAQQLLQLLQRGYQVHFNQQ